MYILPQHVVCDACKGLIKAQACLKLMMNMRFNLRVWMFVCGVTQLTVENFHNQQICTNVRSTMSKVFYFPLETSFVHSCGGTILYLWFLWALIINMVRPHKTSRYSCTFSLLWVQIAAHEKVRTMVELQGSCRQWTPNTASHRPTTVADKMFQLQLWCCGGATDSRKCGWF